MKTVLVTGLIGSGKSQTCRYLSSCGFHVYDCDSRAKALYREVPGLLDRCQDALGVGYEKFASCIFSDSGKREMLESILFPVLLDDIRKWKSECDSSSIAFLESATACDKKAFDSIYDRVILVRASSEIRARRNPLSKVRSMVQNEPQFPDFIINNDNSVQSLHAQIDKILIELQ